jgi:hypothetical protein
MQVTIATTPEVAQAFAIRTYPSITLLRQQDNNNISFQGDPTEATVKSLTDFVGKNIRPKSELIVKFLDLKEELAFVGLFDTADARQTSQARDVLERVRRCVAAAKKFDRLEFA